jgi:hypothetical protein
LRATFAFTIISAMHYVFLVGQRLRAPHQVPIAQAGFSASNQPTS